MHRVPSIGWVVSERAERGRFYPEKAIQMGLPPGRIYKQLQAGVAVTAPGGRVIRPEDVMGPPRPGRKV